MGESSTLISLIETALASFIAGGGILKGIDYLQKRNKDNNSKKDKSKNAKDISELSFAFRQNLQENISRLEGQAEIDEKEIIKLNSDVARLTAENRALENKLIMQKYKGEY